MDKTETLKHILIDISDIERIDINNEQYIKLSDVNDIINEYIDRSIKGNICLVFNKLRYAIDFSHLVGGWIKRSDDGTYTVWW